MAQIDNWAFKLAEKFAPCEDKDGRVYWKNPGDEQRFERYLALSGKCALGRAQFESPRYAGSLSDMTNLTKRAMRSPIMGL